MKTYLDCIPCFLTQSLEAARMTGVDKKVQEKVLKKVMNYLESVDFDSSPPEISREVHHLIRETTGCKDPYKKVKEHSNRMAKKEYDHLKKLVKEDEDPLLMSVKLAIVGNVVDFGTSNRFELEEMIDKATGKDFVDDAFPRFKEVVDEAGNILYLADNTGEVFFDKILIEEIKRLYPKKKIFYVVKKNPIINDVTREDAEYADIDKLAEIIYGDKNQDISAPGFVLRYTSDEFQELLKTSDMVISKGQGNYESLSDLEREVFFLLMVKCPLVSREINVDIANLVLKRHKRIK